MIFRTEQKFWTGDRVNVMYKSLGGNVRTFKNKYPERLHAPYRISKVKWDHNRKIWIYVIFRNYFTEADLQPCNRIVSMSMTPTSFIDEELFEI
jgi:hypothetical protein